ncbi:MAG: secretin N-terminal domain-containing protein, partial [Planctomycetota bacterium]
MKLRSRSALKAALWTWLMAIAVTLSPGTVALAQNGDGGVSTGRPRRADTLDYIRLDVRDKPLREVLAGIGRQVDMNIVADPGVDEKVSVTLDSVEWRKALEIIARETNCTIVDESTRLIRFAQPPDVNMEFQEADLKFVLDILAKQSGANIVIAEDVEGKVTLALQGVPWREALETVVKTAGYVTVEDNKGIKPIIRVVRPEALTRQLENRVIRLKYIRPPEKYLAIIGDVEGVSLDRHSNDPVDAESEFTLLKALTKALSADGAMDYDVGTNTLIVKDVAPSLDAIASIVQKLDVEPPLVQVDVKFISTSSDDVLEAGVKFDLPNTPAREGLRINAFGPDPQPLVTPREAFAGTLNRNIEFGGTYPFDLGRWETIRSGFNALGILDFTETRMLLSMVRDDDNSKIVQEPSLTTLDNHPSTIFVGESVPFAVQEVSQDQNGNVTVAIDENERSPINIGFTLYISPHVVPGTDTINLNVIPKVSSLTGTTSVVEGFDRFSFAADENNNLLTFIDLPREAKQTVVTYLRVQSGHTAVIGGLHSERKFEIETKVPILSSIPILGNLFTWRRKSTDIDHLLILITPRLISSTERADQITREAVQSSVADRQHALALVIDDS